MQKLCTLMLTGLLLAACAGAPPTWWNPGGRYSSAQPSAKKDTAVTATARQKIIIKEETMDALPDVSYEEETLAPLPDAVEVAADAPAVETDENALPVPSVLD